ncbi:Uncharacterized protein Cadr_000016008 [Camelus dromedarius]|uniref:TBC1 domain-containing protein n=1 Tax=Camelus dromedarius TaxID=9838 RepID=A0A5N4E999_CAMDR|nr:uncharacterized protein C9orf152 homolog [Camelus dromedarius]KAB1279982.1 Uncharacterized protein Cadr_000016008 [Camelus dromedarius]
MKGLPCPCPALPHFWQPGSRFMAESSRTQAPGKGPLLSVQLLRAQYEGLRRQQRAQSHLVVLPKGGNMPALAESMVNAVWINKERRPSLSLEEVGPEAEGMLEEADQVSLRAPESPWHTQLEVHCLAQTFHQETSHQVKHKDKFTGSEQSLPQEGDPGLLEENKVTPQETMIPEAAQHGGQVGDPQTKAVGSSLNTGVQCPPSIKNPHRSGKPAHYPFPQRKTPRISQAARNLGLYGPA